MRFFPQFGAYFAGGWIPVLIYLLLLALLMNTMPRGVLARLYSRCRASMAHTAGEILSKCAFLANALIISFARLDTDSALFAAGVTAFALGEIVFVVSVYNYRSVPPDQPATSGLYRFSRNPQIVATLLSLFGICCSVNALLPLVLLAIEAVFMHLKVLEEEKLCLRRYGRKYRLYMESTNRYLPASIY